MITYGEMAQKSDAELVALSLADQNNYAFIIKRYEAQLLRYILRLSGFSREQLGLKGPGQGKGFGKGPGRCPLAPADTN